MIKRIWPLGLPVLLCILLMLPRLFSPQFGLFDDANLLQNVEQIMDGTWNLGEEAGSGRFRPVHWYLYALIYFLAGANPFWFMFANLIQLLLLTTAIFVIMKQYGMTNLQACLASTLFSLSGPVVENAYTLSKGELQQTLWLLASFTSSIYIARHWSGRRKTVIGAGLVILFVLFALASKETSIAILPICAGWLLLAFIRKWRGWEDLEDGIRTRGLYFGATTAAVILYFGLRFAFLPFGLSSRGYSSNYSFSTERMVASARIWIDWLNRDFLFLAPIFVIALYWLVKQTVSRESYLITDAGVWMTVWIALFIPWIYQQEYYLLPFSVGASMFAGAILGRIGKFKQGHEKTISVSFSMALIATFLFTLTLPNNITQARLQLLVDKTNAEMIEHLRTNLPRDSILFVNLSKSSQYLWDLETYLMDIYRREDLRIEGYTFQDPTQEGTQGEVYYILTAHLTNQYYPSIRMGFYEHNTLEWNREMFEHLGNRPQRIFRTIRSMQLTIIDAARLFCPVLRSVSYCQVPDTPIDTRVLTYGWELYKVPLKP